MKILNLLPALLVVESLIFIYIGARGVITRKPFLLHSRWLLGIIVLCMVPAFLMPLLTGSAFHQAASSFPTSGIERLTPILMGVTLLMVFLQMKGYMVYGITDESFRDALRLALQRLNLPFEESLSKIHLPTVGVDLSAAVQARMGVAQLQVKHRRDMPLLKQIASEMGRHFATSSVAINMVTCAFQAAVGVMLIAMAIGLFSMFAKLDHLVGSFNAPPPTAWVIPGPTPSPHTGRGTTLVGTWTGWWHRRKQPALLAVTTQSGEGFDGILMVRTPLGTNKVAIKGTLLSDHRIILQEARVSKAAFGGWALGVDAGNLKSDGLDMRGVGYDTAGSAYSWDFGYRSTKVVVPAN